MQNLDPIDFVRFDRLIDIQAAAVVVAKQKEQENQTIAKMLARTKNCD